MISKLLFRLPLMIVACLPAIAQSGSPQPAQTYLGFDRNDYPGDATLTSLHQTFVYSGYWLNNPPGSNANTWVGKRSLIENAGFGFLVLFNGRLYADLKSVARATALGKSDGQEAINAAHHEGFSSGTIIFLDQEQGGRMLSEQKAYIYSWVDTVNSSGFGAGIYCSGIPARESAKVSVVTAEDIRQNASRRSISFFVTNDSCPPSPGCVFPKNPPKPNASGIDFADIWQFAQSPKRKDFAAGCPANYNRDGNCYSPGVNPSLHLHVDVETATSPDPSHGRSR